MVMVRYMCGLWWLVVCYEVSGGRVASRGGEWSGAQSLQWVCCLLSGTGSTTSRNPPNVMADLALALYSRAAPLAP